MSITPQEMPTKNKPIRDVAYEKIKHAILTGELPAGERIIETVYAEKLHISRTPLREAFRRLEQEGLVNYEVRRGVIVRAFTVDDVEEIYTIRNALMMLIIPSIVERVNDQDIEDLEKILNTMDISQAEGDADKLAVQNRIFHRRMEQISDKKRILRVIDSQEEYIKMFSAMAIASIVTRTTAHQEHHEMLGLLVDKNGQELASLMSHHLADSKATCLNMLAQRQSTLAAQQGKDR